MSVLCVYEENRSRALGANLLLENIRKIVAYEIVAVADQRRTENGILFAQAVNLNPFIDRSCVRLPVEDSIVKIRFEIAFLKEIFWIKLEFCLWKTFRKAVKL